MIRFACSSFARYAPVLLAGVLLFVTPAMASPRPQSDDDDAPPSVSRPVVEPTAPSAGRALNAALERLARDPRNVIALLDAGKAAIALGDNEAALGFFTRADQVAPGNGTVKAAIAGARLHLDDPVEALRWYGDAEKAGADPATFALDRGLAYDLVGDNLAAVAQYRKVIDHSADAAMRDEAIRREAVSLAIGGDRRAGDLALLPLLQQQDRAAWRAHIFVLAIAGRADDAVGVARATMPAELAAAIGPYLRFMVQLTPAQQAAVASLGRFPRAADIGRDDSRIMAYAAAHPRVPLAPAATPTPTQALAAATPDSDAKAARGRHRHGHEPAAAPRPVAAPAPAEPDIGLPPPPPPPTATMATAATPPGAPLASPTTTPPISPLVPRPTVLSRLDMPPSRRTAAAPPIVTAVVAAQQPAATPGAQPVFAPAIPEPGVSGVVAFSLPPSAVGPVAPESHAVVEPTPEKPAARADAARAPHAKPAAEKAAHAEAVTDHAQPAKDSSKDKAAKDAKYKAADDKSGKTKGAHGKAAKDDDADAALVPCKPVASGKGRKAKTAVRQAHGHVAKGKSRHGGKAGKDTVDSDTCAPAAHGDRPDGPAGVARDADSDDDTRTAKGKAKTKGHDKTADRDSDKGSEKASEKGGRHARYASRIWVEVLTGADRDKMPGEWRSLVRKAHKLKGHKPYLSPWRSNFRLLTGPFDSDADAQDFIADLRKDGVSGFEWTSPAGQAVDSLSLP